jgi:hypothetical protein
MLTLVAVALVAAWPHSETTKLALLRSLEVEESHLNTKKSPVLSFVPLLDRKFPYPLCRPSQSYTNDSPRAVSTVLNGLVVVNGS